jgi:proline iminopeptidase
VPNIPVQFLRFMARLPVRAPYRIDDMARDTVGLMEALGLRRPHLVGASMGGMIAQNVAAQFPGTAASLTSIMSTTGRRSLPQPKWKTRRAAAAAGEAGRRGRDRADDDVLRIIGSRTYPPDPKALHEICERHVLRSNHPGRMRQLLAVAARTTGALSSAGSDADAGHPRRRRS